MTNTNRRTFLQLSAATALMPAFGGLGYAADPLKIGFVYLGPVGDHGWTYAHDQGRLRLVERFGDKIATSYIENVPEGPDSERAIRQLAQEGNKLIFTTSFGYMNPTLKVAKQFPDVKFEHSTGYKRSDNVGTYNLRFYQGRAVCGTIAALTSKTGMAGYIASFPIPEVVQGINAFTLAARKINPDFKVKVLWVSTWYDPAKEADAARALMDQGVDIIAQHTDSPAALQACEERGAHAFGQGSDMSAFAPNAHLTSIVNRWDIHYGKSVDAVINGTWSADDSWTGFAEGELEMSTYNKSIPDNVVAAAEAVRIGITDGSMNAFSGKIVDNEGKVRLESGSLDDGALHGMDWYVEGVQS